MNQQLLLCAVASVAFLSSCSNDDVHAPASKGSATLAVNVANLSTKADAATGMKSSFATSDSIGVFVVGTGYTSVVTSYATANGGAAWAYGAYNTTDYGATWGKSTGIQLTGNDADVYAVYPARVKLSDNNPTAASTFNVSVPTSDDFAESGATDYLWGKGGAKVNSNSVDNSKTTITMKHALSKVSFIINKSATYPAAASAGKITKIALSSAAGKIVTGGTTIVGTGAFAPTTYNTGDLTYTSASDTYINAYNATTPPTNVTASFLAAPVAYLGSDLALSITIDGKTMTVTNFPVAPDWSGYKDYQYTITVNPTSLVVSSVIISPWTVTTVTPTDQLIAQ
jgi:hypothetical protein